MKSLIHEHALSLLVILNVFNKADQVPPNISAKCLHLLSLWTNTDRLRLFQTDLGEEGSFDEAVKSCDGVFHVAASMEFSVTVEENIESYVQSNIIEPAIKGTLDLLKSCLNSGTVKRVVLTSSISTLTAKDSKGNARAVVDESCQTPVDQVLSEKANGWVYVLSKILTEEAAFRFANENDINLVSVITSTVGGPFLTSKPPLSNPSHSPAELIYESCSVD
ncbi:Hypothetical predicted protein [Prunus dulcis]|uniref:NAD-dependent epimerase/dehydratase domain-containing protein n=1 Tax=Prunus dulcis TaxID=3755 RepID=A0A5E4FN00_PRUDU|nr:Hypothetical predicted protein [Prunus dulcis]